MIRVLLYGMLEELAGTPETEAGEGRVLDVLVRLSSQYGRDFRDIVLGGGPTRAAILINGTPVRRNVLEAPLKEGDVLSLMPLSGAWDE